MDHDARRLVLYVGCGNASGDVFAYDVDPRDGALTPLANAAAGSSTSFPAVHPSGRFLYVTNNRSDQLTAFSIGEEGALAPLDEAPIAAAAGEPQAGPTYLSFGGAGRFLLAANYRGHNVVVRALGADGRFGAVVEGVAPGRNAHAVVLDPSGRFAFVPCLGSDHVAQYRFDAATGALTPNDPPFVATPAGSGPRHLAFHPNGRFAYLVGETGGDVTVFAFDAGTLRALETVSSVRSAPGERRWSADLAIGKDGRRLYVCNRAEDTLASFALDPETGRLSPLGHVGLPGRTPRQMSLDPSGRLLFAALQDSNAVACFSLGGDGLPQLCRVTGVPASPYFALVHALPARVPC